MRVHTFFLMKQVKSKNRNQTADETLDDSLQIATTNTGVEKGMTVSEKFRPHVLQQVSHLISKLLCFVHVLHVALVSALSTWRFI